MCHRIGPIPSTDMVVTYSYLQVADSSMTTAVKLVFPQALVSGSTPLVSQLMGDRVLNSSTFAQQSPSALRLDLGSKLVLELLVLSNAEASSLSELGCGALHSHRTSVIGTGWKLDGPARDHGKRLAVRTGDAQVFEVQFGLLGTTWLFLSM